MAAKVSVFVVVVLGFAGLALGDVPHLLNYQGRLTDDTGKPVNDVKEMRFSFYDVQAGGTMLFAETQNVAVTNGIFNVLIGSATVGGVPADIFAGPNAFLGVTVDGEEQTPRQRIVSVGYAFRALKSDLAAEALHAEQADRAAQSDDATTAGYADTANYAHSAGNAGHATIADAATTAVNADMASFADIANYAHGAGTADSATAAGTATTANHADMAGFAEIADYAHTAGNADNAESAAYAYNADLLDNFDSTEFVRQGDMSAAIATHSASADHDVRYYTETESDARFALKGETAARTASGLSVCA